MTDTPQGQVPEALKLREFLMAEVKYEEGWLYWKHAVQGRAAGSRLGSIDPRGYVRCQFMGRKWAAHRLIYLMHHGWLPDLVDHADGNTSNNKIDNLRAATKGQNTCNSKTRADNKLGVKGVCFDILCQRWAASVMLDGKRWKETFPTYEEACARVAAKRLEIHGAFANHGVSNVRQH